MPLDRMGANLAYLRFDPQNRATVQTDGGMLCGERTWLTLSDKVSQLARVATSSRSFSKKMARLNNRRDYPVHIFPSPRGTERRLTTPGVQTHLAWCGIPLPLFNAPAAFPACSSEAVQAG
jgi:hypothetical protein